jgi:hypothetical protein
MSSALALGGILIRWKVAIAMRTGFPWDSKELKKSATDTEQQLSLDRFSQVDVEQILSDLRTQFKSEVLSTRHRYVHRCGNMAVMFSGHLLPVGIKNYIRSGLRDISSR